VKRYIRLTLILLTIQPLLRAQELHPQFRCFTVKEGLPSLETYDVLQDSKGYIWIGTDAGVARYDGYSFRIFTSQDGLSDNTVFELFEDKHGRIWFRTFNGAISYYYKDSIYSIPCNDKLKKLREGGISLSFYVDDHDTLWIGAAMKQSPLRIAPPLYDSVVLPPKSTGNYINYISEFPHYAICGTNFLYNESPPLAITILNGAQRKKDISFTEQVNSTWQHFRVVKKTDGTILYTSANVLVEISTGYTVRTYRYNSRVTSVYEDGDHNVWVGLYRGGVLMYPGGDLDKPPSHFLSNRSITCILKDNENSYWFTSLEEGVFMIPSLNFLTYRLPRIPLHNKPARVLPDGEKVWIAVGDTGIALIENDRPAKFFAVKKDEIGLIQSLVKLKTGEIVGAGAHRVMVIKDGNAYVKNHDFYPKMIIPSMNGGYWKISHERLVKIENEENIFTLMLNFRPDVLFEDTAGNLWLGGIDGLWAYRDGQLNNMNHLHPLLENRIVDIKMRGAEMWLATRGNGVIFLAPDTAINITTRQGLPSDICRSLCFDSRGDLWLGTNKGISHIKVVKGYLAAVKNFNSMHGLVSDDVRQVTSSGNRVYVATTSGVTMFDISRLSPGNAPPPVYLTRVEVNGKQRAVQSGLVLEHNENYLNFYFTGLTYKVPGSTRYIYQLEGVDEVWRSTSSTYAQYTTLPPGTYTFRVYAVNHDGIKSAVPATFALTISKPFWATWWFITICVLLAIALITLVVMLRERAIRSREAERSKLNQKMSDLELKSIRAQMNPHFIFNALNSIQRFVLANDPFSAQKYLTKFARLIRNVLNNSRTEMISLSKELETLNIYIELESLRFGDQFSYNFEVEDRLDVNNLQVPSMFIQPYVENAIWHGLMHKQDNRQLLIKIFFQNNKLVCEVEDNGVGRAQSKQLNSIERKDHQSIGTALGQERIAVLNQVHKTDIRAIFIDLKDDEGKPCGTRVRIEFPITYAHPAE
jgi:ligand-binding sensor domain-containing protein